MQVRHREWVWKLSCVKLASCGALYIISIFWHIQDSLGAEWKAYLFFQFLLLQIYFHLTLFFPSGIRQTISKNYIYIYIYMCVCVCVCMFVCVNLICFYSFHTSAWKDPSVHIPQSEHAISFFLALFIYKFILKWPTRLPELTSRDIIFGVLWRNWSMSPVEKPRGTEAENHYPNSYSRHNVTHLAGDVLPACFFLSHRQCAYQTLEKCSWISHEIDNAWLLIRIFRIFFG